MWIDIFWIVAGLALILKGATLLTDGSAAIAKRLGVSDLIVGLTVVAFGTSTPELVISSLAAVGGSSEMAIGNVAGSNIFNILGILGITAMVAPIAVKKSVMVNEIPMLILSSLLLLILGYSASLNDLPQSVITRTDGLLLLLFFVIFLRYVFASARSNGDSSDNSGDKQATMSWAKSVIFIILGLTGLIFGGSKFVDGASGIARVMGVSDAVIGLTIVAIGTSLPELAASVVAALKGENGLAIGNVIGSNIFNVLMVLGTSATIKPLQFGDIGPVDLFTLLGASLLFWLFGWKFRRHLITRAEGAVMTACYVAYMSYIVISA